MSRAPLMVLCAALCLGAAPAWQAPTKLPFGALQELRLRETDPRLPALPRPELEERLGPLHLRALEPLPDGRGWRFQVQALTPGVAVIPPLEFGDGRRSPELRLEVPRDVPHGAPWMGLGGGREDRLPPLPFPWAWTSLLVLPGAALAAGATLRWRRGAQARRLLRATEAFRQAWPPANLDRAALDQAHAQGRALLALRFGDAAAAWGAEAFEAQGLPAWAAWCRALDAARFGGATPDLPSAEALLAALSPEARP